MLLGITCIFILQHIEQVMCNIDITCLCIERVRESPCRYRYNFGDPSVIVTINFSSGPTILLLPNIFIYSLCYCL